MSNRLPVEVNPFRLVEQRAALQGQMPLAPLHRLREMLSNDTGVVKVKLDFNRTETGLPVIAGKLITELNLCCQRCLKNLIYPLVTSVEVVLVTTDTQAQQVQEGYDIYLVEDDRLFLQDFIEDEILLKLPFSVMHETCQAVRPYTEALPEDEPAGDRNTETGDARENPFASLQRLKKIKDLE